MLSPKESILSTLRLPFYSHVDQQHVPGACYLAEAVLLALNTE